MQKCEDQGHRHMLGVATTAPRLPARVCRVHGDPKVSYYQESSLNCI